MRVPRGWVSAKPSFLGECTPHAGLVSKAGGRARIEGKEVGWWLVGRSGSTSIRRTRRGRRRRGRRRIREEEEEETKGAEGRKEEKKGRAEVGRKLRCSVSRVPDSSARRFGEPVVGEPSVHDTRSHLRPTGASCVRLHAHATARLLKVLLTSEIYSRGYRLAFPDHSFISSFHLPARPLLTLPLG